MGDVLIDSDFARKIESWIAADICRDLSDIPNDIADICRDVDVAARAKAITNAIYDGSGRSAKQISNYGECLAAALCVKYVKGADASIFIDCEGILLVRKIWL